MTSGHKVKLQHTDDEAGQDYNEICFKKLIRIKTCPISRFALKETCDMFHFLLLRRLQLQAFMLVVLYSTFFGFFVFYFGGEEINDDLFWLGKVFIVMRSCLSVCFWGTEQIFFILAIKLNINQSLFYGQRRPQLI